MSSTETEIVVASANIAGGMRAGKGHPHKFRLLADALAKHQPDIIGLQEVVRVPDAGRDDLQKMQDKLPGQWVADFFPHLDSYMQPHPKKWSSKIFADHFSKGQRILQGNGVLVRKAHPILNLWSGIEGTSSDGRTVGRIMPVPSMIYCGNRDTEAYSLLMTRLMIRDKTILFCCTHLSTLKEEDQDPQGGKEKIRKPTAGAIARRREQARWIVEYLESYQEELGQKEPIVFVGDFNCEPNASELRPLGWLGLRHAHLGQADRWIERTGWDPHPGRDGSDPPPPPPHTHRERWVPSTERKILIDHVFVSENLKVTNAIILDLDFEEEKSGIRGTISDHHPVVITLLLP